jgi:pimeloyl-ACP methyl ester carboxylesterase
MQATASAANGFETQTPRWSPPRGRILHRALRNDPTTEYYCYAPASSKEGSRVLAVIHGISGRALDYAQIFAPYCEDHGVVLLVPHFAEHHRDFQRLGRQGRGPRADEILHQCLGEVATLTGANVAEVYLFGYSAGAQFAHRYAMAHPHRVARVVLGASGWYTFPDPEQRFPYGIRPIRKLRGLRFTPEEFLKVPMQVLIGSDDLDSMNLRSTTRVNKQQGVNRVERARRWVKAMQRAAKACGLAPLTTYTEVQGVSHDFDEFCRKGGLASRVVVSLFGDLPAATVSANQPAINVQSAA